MKKYLIILIAAILIAVSIITVNLYNNGPNPKNITNTLPSIKPNNIKIKAQDFKLKDLEGKEVSLSDYKGKKVFLNFWATWCPPCKSEMPEIEQLYKETKDNDLVILTVEIGESRDTVKSFIDSNKYNFKVLLDSDQNVASQYNIASIPTSYFIDVEGNIVSKNIGAMNIDKMKQYIKTLDK